MNPLNISSEIVKKFTYDQFTSITQSSIFLIILIGVWAFILILYFIIAGSIRVRTASGTKLKGSLLSKPTGWIAPILWIIQGALYLIFIIFPLWLGSKTI